ncbi:MAG: hypothetical protein LBQ09_01020 [Acidobacteriaceae bacterium]|nr:hypothetical protein [Acidobacteriaceae bacterium]
MKQFVRQLALGSATLALVALATPAFAESPVNFDFGYQYLMHTGAGGNTNYPAGFNIDVAVAVSDAIRVVGEGSWSRDSSFRDVLNNNDVTLTATSYGGGLRWASHTEGIASHLQLIAGIHHDSYSTGLGNAIDNTINGGNNKFMLQPGFGIVIPIAPAVGILGQADYRRVFYDGNAEKNFYRFIAGIRIGR